MNRYGWAVLAGSATLGTVLASLSPRHWGFSAWEGALLGVVIYVAVLRGYLVGSGWSGLGPTPSRVPPARVAAGLTARAAGFLVLVTLQAYLTFDLVPDPDVRRGFIVLSSWVIAQALSRGRIRGGDVGGASA